MIRVIQIIDSLNAGGAERVAVNYANGLTNIIEKSHICVTREEGPLKDDINPEVGYLFLNKNSTLDVNAILKLKQYVSKNGIDIMQAHSSSFFIALLVKMLYPKVKIVWHDHYGNSEFLDKRPKTVLRFSSKFFSYIFSVNSQLEEWSKKNLLCKNVRYIKNFPVLKKSVIEETMLKGNKEKRILCLANLRKQKNHIRLLEAFEVVNKEFPDWTLHCVGKDFKDEYSELFFSKIKELNLERHAYFYDSRSDILNIMCQSNIGVLVSKSEGLPLALLEYGLAQLPVISTDVGYCGKLVSDQSYGILLESDDKMLIANAITDYIKNVNYRESAAINFNKKIVNEYSSARILDSCLEIYKTI
ncbi:glycosyltransferase [Winogradskyella echinorum]|uniref:Glycosyltransferase n=1 Tax=Winogradskyella echinorum TaxID=538189 RepID=A0ABR6Y2G8_9FLAO|nr:glycosyltransferase [Winogradskyella echinorum]MBC3846937.1 glycosyltransferase [Winogradskyella echinorum]MBC5751285.1 glycosyltransferase [Winogradskyella echinorum]